MEQNTMELVSVIKLRILELCEVHDISIHALAVKSNLPPSSIKNILYGRSKNPTINVIKQICCGFNITLQEFFSSTTFDNIIYHEYD